MNWQACLVILGFFVAVVCFAIAIVSDVPDILPKPWGDPRAARHRDFTVGGDAK